MRSMTVTLSMLSLMVICSNCRENRSYDGKIQVGTSREATTPEQEEEEKKALADEPAQVAGAFLSMGFMESQDNVAKTINTQPNDGLIEIAICWRNASLRTLPCLDESHLNVSYELLTADKTQINLDRRPAPSHIDFNWILAIPVRHLQGTIISQLNDNTSQNAVRLRSLVTIDRFNAKDSIKITEDQQFLGQSQDEIKQLIHINQSTNPKNPGSPQTKKEILSKFWKFTLQLLGDFHGPSYGEPVTDYTTEIFVKCPNPTCTGGLPYEQAAPGIGPDTFFDDYNADFIPIPVEFSKKPPTIETHTNTSTATQESAATDMNTASATTTSNEASPNNSQAP